jgi:hypothetical protein
MLRVKCNSNTYSLSDTELLFHFTWIKNMSALLSKQLSARDHKTYICERCLNYFRTVDLLEKHKSLCLNINNMRLEAHHIKSIQRVA